MSHRMFVSHRSRRLRFFALAAAAACFCPPWACTPQVAEPVVEAPGTGEVLQPVAGQGANGKSEAFIPGGPGFVLGQTVIRREASDSKEVADTGSKKKKQSNVMALLARGEQVTVLSVKDDWYKVRLSDNQEGYAKADALLTDAGVQLATVFERAKTFSRPDLLALSAGKEVEPGSLVMVVRSKPPFSEVNAGGRNNTWMLADVLTSEPKEVEAAKLVQRARSLDERHDGAAQGIWDLAKGQFGSTRLMQMLLAPPTPPPGEGTDPAATGDAAQAPVLPTEGDAGGAMAVP